MYPTDKSCKCARRCIYRYYTRHNKLWGKNKNKQKSRMLKYLTICLVGGIFNKYVY